MRIRRRGSDRLRLPGLRLIFKPDADDRPALIEDERFSSPPYYGPSGWLTLDFEAAPVDWDEAREPVDASYRQIALKRHLKALDGAGRHREQPLDPRQPSTPRTDLEPRAARPRRAPPVTHATQKSRVPVPPGPRSG